MSYAAAVANMKAALVHAGKIGKMHGTVSSEFLGKCSELNHRLEFDFRVWSLWQSPKGKRVVTH